MTFVSDRADCGVTLATATAAGWNVVMRADVSLRSVLQPTALLPPCSVNLWL